MTTKEQYKEILDSYEKYIKMCDKPMSVDFQDGMMRVLDLIQPMFEKY